MRILVLTKRQYTNKDLIDDKYGRIRELPLELGRLGHEIKGLCLSYQWKPELRIKDETVLWDSCNATGYRFLGLFKFIFKATKMAARADIIIASSDSVFGIIGFMIAKVHSIPLIFDLYDNYEYFLLARLPIFKQLYRWVVRKCHGVSCVSRPLAGLAQSYGRKKPIIVLENAIQPNLFKALNMHECRKALNMPENGVLIGMAGALHPNSGILVLFEAFDHLKRKFPDLWLVLAGPCKIDIPSDPKIIYLGNLPENKVPLVLNLLDIAVICVTENDFGKYCFPQKVREIMACDIPMVAARVGAMRDILAGYPQEWLFSPNDAKDLARAITFRLKDKSTNYTGVKSWKDIGIELDRFIASKVGVQQKRSFQHKD